jgi:ferredoxin-fold anticodon binding domain-containing protein
MELAFHHKYHKNRHHGEWFALKPDELNQLLSKSPPLIKHTPALSRTLAPKATPVKVSFLSEDELEMWKKKLLKPNKKISGIYRRQ